MFFIIAGILMFVTAIGTIISMSNQLKDPKKLMIKMQSRRKQGETDEAFLKRLKSNNTMSCVFIMIVGVMFILLPVITK